MMLSGLRRGELAALTWNDVDLQARTISVSKVIEYDSNGSPSLRHVTKSAAGMHTVDIPQRLADYMAQMPRDSLLVIHSAHGKVMTESAWAKLWRSYMKELNRKYGTRTLADMKRMKSGKPEPKALDMTISTDSGIRSVPCCVWRARMSRRPARTCPRRCVGKKQKAFSALPPLSRR